MNPLIILCCLFFCSSPIVGNKAAVKIETTSPNPIPALSILFPKKDQKVRGDCKIYGRAKPGAIVKLTVTSKYFKTAHDNNDKISKGEGPVNRMNRKFSLTTDRSGNWILKSIELRNPGWEESYVITASSEGKTVSVNVYDNVHPVRMD